MTRWCDADRREEDVKGLGQGGVEIISRLTFWSPRPLRPPPAHGTGGAQGEVGGHRSAPECGNTADGMSESMKGQTSDPSIPVLCFLLWKFTGIFRKTYCKVKITAQIHAAHACQSVVHELCDVRILCVCVCVWRGHRVGCARHGGGQSLWCVI